MSGTRMPDRVRIRENVSTSLPELWELRGKVVDVVKWSGSYAAIEVSTGEQMYLFPTDWEHVREEGKDDT